MPSKAVWIGITIGVFFGGLGIGYAAWGSYYQTPGFGQMGTGGMGMMMSDSQMQQMMGDPGFMEDMMNDPGFQRQMFEHMEDNDELMHEMMRDYEMREHMMGHMMEDHELLENMGLIEMHNSMPDHIDHD